MMDPSALVILVCALVTAVAISFGLEALRRRRRAAFWDAAMSQDAEVWAWVERRRADLETLARGVEDSSMPEAP